MPTERIEQRYGCEGYYGFGGGVNIITAEVRTQDGELYCGAACPRKHACWPKHVARARAAFPALAEEVDRRREKHGGNMAKAIAELADENDGKVLEPATVVMMGNVEDGMAVAYGAPVRNRGQNTLPYPFKRQEVTRAD